ncbi:uncharacterized protein LOC144625248 isoform X2 [Crassostrea virginica]
MWMRWFSQSDVRMLAQLSLVMPNGRNDFWGVEEGPVYLKRSLPAALTTTTARARKSATQISEFLFSLRFSLMDLKERLSLGSRSFLEL